MPCPLCDHTMQNLGVGTHPRRVFWCPRCGTLKTEDGDHVEHEAPKLAVRAMQYMPKRFDLSLLPPPDPAAG